MIGKADAEDAKKKATQIIKQMRKNDNRHQYRVKDIKLDLKKVGKAEWWYVLI